MDNNVEIENKGKKNPTKTILLISFIVIIILCVAMLFAQPLLKKDNNSSPANDKNGEKATPEKESPDEEEKINIKLNDEEVLNHVGNYIQMIPIKDLKCEGDKITKDCLPYNVVLGIVFCEAERDQAYTDEKEVEEVNKEDFISYKVLNNYLKNMFDIDNYKYPSDYEKLNNYCHTYENTETGVKRFTDGPGCSFGGHTSLLEGWIYEYGEYTTEGSELIVGVTAIYNYNEDLYEKETVYCTDETRKTCYSELNSKKYYKDPSFQHYKYHFTYQNNHFVFKYIEN